ncbi:MAG: hypothetical protein JW927_02575 [Deltaproteobacteria bacterium]|nr:hypothetical protein [Deltaproteobacteria bacterium]
MKKYTIILLILLPVFIASCSNNRVWQNKEFVEWYGKYWQDNNNKNIRELYYQGTDSDYHHFIIHTVDSWLSVRIDRNEIKLIEEKPYKPDSSAPFPGYYIVDPMNGFKRIETK